ncbi:hypothetical protein ABD90_20895 [Lysinibacillus fusiformis]|uniref:Uncharacterized protein n=1 Tax=Lysinibacillus sphaericus CBAM5 TaxID=1400869 RepID=W7S5D3_LYSSH|nr:MULTISPECIES: hypothetical protein [Lysinibacillus]MBE5083547.1 hypothetical protein [Bacillus thuringiensis]UZM97836.1 hypothetical protein OL548_23135 [Lysinibacillus sp. MHQ-1]AMO33436.1 hypothetical protein AR327_13795 [Lysinibacillus sphaericus]AMR91462.1 hypothetical protein A1T07_15425 [Lysinibacillus sphaericus]ANA45509.1 hypothetical protein A2J09_08085 [Lysinibacillus sphaericus]
MCEIRTKEVKDTFLIQWVSEGIPNDSVRNVNESYYDTSNATLENEKSSNELVYEAMKIIALE